MVICLASLVLTRLFKLFESQHGRPAYCVCGGSVGLQNHGYKWDGDMRSKTIQIYDNQNGLLIFVTQTKMAENMGLFTLYDTVNIVTYNNLRCIHTDTGWDR